MEEKPICTGIRDHCIRNLKDMGVQVELLENDSH